MDLLDGMDQAQVKAQAWGGWQRCLNVLTRIFSKVNFQNQFLWVTTCFKVGINGPSVLCNGVTF